MTNGREPRGPDGWFRVPLHFIVGAIEILVGVSSLEYEDACALSTGPGFPAKVGWPNLLTLIFAISGKQEGLGYPGPSPKCAMPVFLFFFSAIFPTFIFVWYIYGLRLAFGVDRNKCPNDLMTFEFVYLAFGFLMYLWFFVSIGFCCIEKDLCWSCVANAAGF